MDDRHAQQIAETAQRMRDSGDDSGVEDYLRTQLQLARERGDVASEVVSLEWLATTLAFSSRRPEGLQCARQAYAASSGLPEVKRVQSGLVLAGLLAGGDTQLAQEAQSVLEDLGQFIVAADLDTRFEDMRLQRLEAVLRRSGEAETAARVSGQVDQLRSLGAGFSNDHPSRPLITSFGVLWRRDWVAWSRTPVLLGRRTTKPDEIDLSDQRGVYVLLHDSEVIHVGTCVHRGLAQMLNAHTFDRLSNRWDRFSWFGLRLPPSEEGMDDDVPVVCDRTALADALQLLMSETLQPRVCAYPWKERVAVEYIQIQGAVLETDRSHPGSA